MAPDDHGPYQEDLAAYLLDGLDPQDASGFRQHLASCARCQADERWLRAAVDVLPSSVQQLEPPPALRMRMMSTIRTEAAADQESEGGEARRRLFGLGFRPAAALASVAILVAGIAGYLIGKDEDTSVTTVRAPAAQEQPARWSIVRTGDIAVLRVRRLPPPRPRHVYQAWLARGKQVEPSSLFTLQRDGSASAAIPDSLKGVKAVMVSEEPKGGSSKPTSKPVLIAKL
jgi:anti-sigma-K factor RskA